MTSGSVEKYHIKIEKVRGGGGGGGGVCTMKCDPAIWPDGVTLMMSMTGSISNKGYGPEL